MTGVDLVGIDNPAKFCYVYITMIKIAVSAILSI